MTKDKKNKNYDESYKVSKNNTKLEEEIYFEMKRIENRNFKRMMKGMAIVAGLGIAIAHNSILYSLFLNKESDDYGKERDDFSIIMINNGEITIKNNVSKKGFISNEDNGIFGVTEQFHREINNVEYEISYYNSNVLVIYTYDKDDITRKSVTDYIISNIKIDDNNIIYFDESKLNQEGYINYVNSVINNNNQGVQRIRKSTQNKD